MTDAAGDDPVLLLVEAAIEGGGDLVQVAHGGHYQMRVIPYASSCGSALTIGMFS
jgi:hypothetical protein